MNPLISLAAVTDKYAAWFRAVTLADGERLRMMFIEHSSGSIC